MKIRSRLMLSIIPPTAAIFIIGSLLFFVLARGGIDSSVRDLLNFKAFQFQEYIAEQWNILVEFELYQNPEYLTITNNSIREYALGILKTRNNIVSDGDADNGAASEEGSADQLEQRAELSPEVIFIIQSNPITNENSIIISSRKKLINLEQDTIETLLTNGPLEDGKVDFEIINLNNQQFAYTSFLFEPFNWLVIVGEQVSSFYRAVAIIQRLSTVILSINIILFIAIIGLLSRSITKPLTSLAHTAQAAIKDITLESVEHVPIQYDDENGILAHTINTMFNELRIANSRLKEHAFVRDMLQHQEQRVRTIFQSYVPQDVVDQYLRNPERLLVTENKDVVVLFSDIRNFTALSEKIQPDKLVVFLNSYFTKVVQSINEKSGLVDKFIGDAVMAIYGAPIKHKNDVLASLDTAFTMLKIAKQYRKPNTLLENFKIGIGLHYGIATIGNIGSEQRLSYTAIGDSVNLTSRIENLCKTYNTELLTSHEFATKAGDKYRRRYVDTIAVRGRTQRTALYTFYDSLSATHARALDKYDEAIACYTNKEHSNAITLLKESLKIKPDDFITQMYIQRLEQPVKK